MVFMMGSVHHSISGDDEEYEEEEEFNANLIGNRRRGDKGLW
jgi:hypothetical protein